MVVHVINQGIPINMDLVPTPSDVSCLMWFIHVCTSHICLQLVDKLTIFTDWSTVVVAP